MLVFSTKPLLSFIIVLIHYLSQLEDNDIFKWIFHWIFLLYWLIIVGNVCISTYNVRSGLVKPSFYVNLVVTKSIWGAIACIAPNMSGLYLFTLLKMSMLLEKEWFWILLSYATILDLISNTVTFYSCTSVKNTLWVKWIPFLLAAVIKNKISTWLCFILVKLGKMTVIIVTLMNSPVENDLDFM